MSVYKRLYVPGGSYFFTVVTYERRLIFDQETARTILGNKFRDCMERWPFRVDAIVLLPDHLHAIWTLPEGDDAFPKRWGWIKKEFTKEWLAQGGQDRAVSLGKQRHRRKGVWQPRYWEHCLQGEEDYENHFHYLHYNPVKHGYVQRVRDWPHSSFHRWVKEGAYTVDWGGDASLQERFQEMEELEELE